ncbi:hypothetical protein C8J56DRAFT_1054203 [Mycena floridula]|nr:hypothetical protein C8J56DRAFT_1054203 [Mycena floridula]
MFCTFGLQAKPFPWIAYSNVLHIWVSSSRRISPSTALTSPSLQAKPFPWIAYSNVLHIWVGSSRRISPSTALTPPAFKPNLFLGSHTPVFCTFGSAVQGESVFRGSSSHPVGNIKDEFPTTQLDNQICEVLISSESTTFSKIVNKWNTAIIGLMPHHRWHFHADIEDQFDPDLPSQFVAKDVMDLYQAFDQELEPFGSRQLRRRRFVFEGDKMDSSCTDILLFSPYKWNTSRPSLVTDVGPELAVMAAN